MDGFLLNIHWYCHDIYPMIVNEARNYVRDGYALIEVMAIPPQIQHVYCDK